MSHRQVGHTYTKKVEITNRSYAKNTYKVLEVGAGAVLVERVGKAGAVDHASPGDY
jgi:hypothetical protein